MHGVWGSRSAVVGVRLRFLVGVGSGVGGRLVWIVLMVFADFCGVMGVSFEAESLCCFKAEGFWRLRASWQCSRKRKEGRQDDLLPR